MKPYEVRQIKETATGKRYLVRHNTYGKWIICSSVNEAGIVSAIQSAKGNTPTLQKNGKKFAENGFH